VEELMRERDALAEEQEAIIRAKQRAIEGPWQNSTRSVRRADTSKQGEAATAL
jgi:hypothetical protein